VPQEIAVLGVDNDELICETTQPRLSSIQMNTEQAGFEAARVLDRMMRRNPRGTTRQTVIAFGFSQVVTRRSTEPLQIADPLVARAIHLHQRRHRVDDRGHRASPARFPPLAGETFQVNRQRGRLGFVVELKICRSTRCRKNANHSSRSISHL